MTQRVFDIENEKDMQDLWNILPDGIKKISPNYSYNETSLYADVNFIRIPIGLIKINWHDATEITRPIPEATSEDVGKLCRFWDDEESYIGILADITNIGGTTYHTMSSPAYGDLDFLHCRRLTKQEIEELC